MQQRCVESSVVRPDLALYSRVLTLNPFMANVLYTVRQVSVSVSICAWAKAEQSHLPQYAPTVNIYGAWVRAVPDSHGQRAVTAAAVTDAGL